MPESRLKAALRWLSSAGWFFWLSAMLFGTAIGLYLKQPDGAYALTVYSPWAPGLIGSFVTILGSLRSRRKAVFLLAVGWLIWGLFASEEMHALLRRGPGDEELNTFRYDGRRIRIVSLNCAGGSIEAAREVKSWNPDIVLLQETPSAKELAPLAKEMFGPKAGLLVGPDASILSRYSLKSCHAGAGERLPSNFLAAYAGTPWGTILIASLRLSPPVLRFDYWNLECWQDYANGKRHRRQELQELMNDLARFDDDWPMIVGGDFNAAPDRASAEVLEKRGGLKDSSLFDAARVAGVGWTMTAVNQFPLVRIDQVWVDHRLEPLRAIAAPTKHSDHRMVVVDVMIKQ